MQQIQLRTFQKLREDKILSVAYYEPQEQELQANMEVWLGSTNKPDIKVV
jgi:hypothetical protein